MGRHYSEDEALDFWLAGHADEDEVEDPDSLVPTEQLRDAWEHFGEKVDKSLKKHLKKADYERIYDDEGEESVTSDVYATLAGHGVGIWDGRWGPYLSDTKIETLTVKLKKDLGKYVDSTGGGSLEEEFHEAVYEQNPMVAIQRKGYTTKRGVHVKPARFKVKDQGRPGVRSFGAKSATGKYAKRRHAKPLITHDGTLGGAGYTKKATATRHKLLDKCVKEFGYRSCLGKVQVLLISTAIKPATRKVLEADKKWLMKKYGGSGSFGTRKGKKKTAKKRTKNPVSLRSIMMRAGK